MEAVDRLRHQNATILPLVWIHDYHLTLAAGIIRQVFYYPFILFNIEFWLMNSHAPFVSRFNSKQPTGAWPSNWDSFYTFPFRHGTYSDYFRGPMKFSKDCWVRSFSHIYIFLSLCTYLYIVFANVS